jgi:predicted transcriptional regulator
MATKKELLREKIGKQYIYWINPSSNEAKTILSRLQEKLFGGKKSSFVSYLLENDNELSEEELTHIETLITTHKNKQKNG